MNVKYLNNGNNLFIFTTNIKFARILKDYAPSQASKNYWDDVITFLSNHTNVKSHITKTQTYNNVLKIVDNFELANDEIAYYIDKNLNIIENFLYFDNERLNSLIDNNIAPYHAEFIGIFKKNNLQTPVGYILLNNLKKRFAKRLYRIGIMSDIHYNDNDLSDHSTTIYHSNGNGEYISDAIQAFDFYRNKDKNENLKFVAAAGDISSDNMHHLINFASLTRKTLQIPFYTCFGNHDYRSTANWYTVDYDADIYDENDFKIKDKTRLQVWNSILIPENPEFIIHYQNPNTDYGKTSYWFEVPTVNGKSDIYLFLSVNYLNESDRVPYVNYVWEKMNSEYCTVDITRGNGDSEILKPTEDYNIVIKYYRSGERVLYNYHYSQHNYNYTHTVQIHSYKVIDANGNDITTYINASSPYLGINGNDRYHVDGKFECNTVQVTNISEDFQFEINCSSAFSSHYSNINFPITLYLNCEAAYHSDISDVNKTTSANYKLTSTSPYMSDILEYIGEYNLNDYDFKFYDNEALLWLKNVLETYQNKRIFIFTHQFFPQKSGGNHGLGYSYILENGRITTSSAYCLCGVQFEFLNKLNNEYKNTIWFTGHSHYNYDTQITDPTCIVCNKDYDIYRPGDSDFSQSVRYHRRNAIWPSLEQTHEYYTDKTNTHVGEHILFTKLNNIPNGIYEVKLIAASLYTPNRGFNSILYDGTNTLNTPVVWAYATTELNNYYNHQLVETRTGPSIIWPKDELTYTLQITVTNNFLETGLYKYNEGINWVICSIDSITNIYTNERIDVSNLKWYKYNESEAQLTSLSFAPTFYTLKDKVHGFNITNHNTGYNIHVPSTSRPLSSNAVINHELTNTYGKDSNIEPGAVTLESSCRPMDSEGMIMDIYENYVDIRGVIFKNENIEQNQYINKYHPLGQYRIPIKSN